MTRFNLSEWALGHRSFIWYLMLLVVAAGLLSYRHLGREEDPSFTIKSMVIQANWPGATVEEMTNQVTDRIERKLQELETLDFTKSYTTPGQTTVFVNLKDETPGRDIRAIWVQVRNKINDIRQDLPTNVQGPFFNDQFGDVFGNIYALTADGLSLRQLRDYAEQARSQILKIPGAGRVELLGVQDEVIYLDFSTQHIAGLGIDQQAAINSLQQQNAVVPSGVVQAGPERVSLRVSGQFTSVESLRAVNIRVNDRFFRLSDVATISRGYVDPPSNLFRYNGQPAIGIAIGMKPNNNLVEFGKALRARMLQVVGDLPIGVGVHLVSNQPAVVEEAIGGFTQALFEAVAIVMLVSFLSLGLRAGLVVAVAIPLVLAGTFIFMEYAGIGLQRISLGALIIALGLLVDDAMISVEMMVARREAGDTLERAATFAYSSTAFPMLTGTLVTVAGFVPIGLNGSSAGEYTYSLFAVIAAALLISWVVAVLLTPLLGVTMLPRTAPAGGERQSRLKAWFLPALLRTMRWRWLTIAVTLGLFAVSLFAFRYVQDQFFPASDRPELLVDMTLPQNSSIAETKKQMDRLEKTLAGDPDIVRWSSYVGRGAVRFYLPLDEQLGNPFFGQIVIVARDFDARERLGARLKQRLRQDFVGIDGFVHPLELGPPVGRPVQYRLSGPDIQQVRGLALQFAEVMASNPHLGNIVYDWNEPGMVLRIDVDQNRARQLGVSSQDISTVLNNVVGGSSITQVYDSIYIVDIVPRADRAERVAIETFQGLQLAGRNGQPVPLSAIATVQYTIEQPIVYRRDRQPTITLYASIGDDLQPATIVGELKPAVAAFEAKLPPDYSIAIGGTVEESGKGERPIAAVVPLMLLLMATVLMLQLQSFQKLFLVVSVAPLGLIGVVAALLLSDKPLGFVAILGVLALIGIIIRNSVILVAQIDSFRAEGLAPWDAVVEATTHRMRPILLTAAAASLGMIPIAREVFWGPMAFAMIGGIVVATMLTLFFLPALYVTWYRIREPNRP
ncbi:efflux RND transporter permease subunit [Reyranella sp.]|uniref:efflux RND transporter permease subunit n=1 Tax=Reyranella sp. TaxID=1929291 RepID=UPI003BAAB8D2